MADLISNLLDLATFPFKLVGFKTLPARNFGTDTNAAHAADHVPPPTPSAMSFPPPGPTPEQIAAAVAARDAAGRARLALEQQAALVAERQRQEQQLAGIKSIPLVGQVASVGKFIADTFSLGGRTVVPIDEIDPYNTIYGPNGYVGGNPWFTGGVVSFNMTPMFIDAFVKAYQHAKDYGVQLAPIQQYFLDHKGALPPPAGSVAPGALNPATDAMPTPQAGTVPVAPNPSANSMAVASGSFIRSLLPKTYTP